MLSGWSSWLRTFGLSTGEPGRLTPADWAKRLTEEKHFLLSFISEMEAEFLATGAGFQRLAQQKREVQQQCDALVGLVVGGTEDSPIQFALYLLRKAEDLIQARYDQYDEVFATFRELHQRLCDLPKQHEGLQLVLSPLIFITVAFRIEASRHPAEVQGVFFTLAADVSRMLSDVRDTMDRQFAEIAASERSASTLMEGVSASIQQHRKLVGQSMESSYIHLRSLHDALACAGEGAAGLTTLNQDVSRYLGHIVMAQQCQDIARQKIEHVGEAMDEMSEHLGTGAETGARGAADSRHFVDQAGQIQQRQVQDVFDELTRAADTLQAGMQSLRANSGAAAEVAVKVGAATLDAKAGRRCQGTIGEVPSIIDQAVKNTADVLAAFQPLQASFINCTDIATRLAIDLRLIALNAQIFAIQSANGATLEVLAGRMHVISDETIQHVGKLEQPLRDTADKVNNLRQRLTDFRELEQAEQQVLIDEAKVSQRKLADLETAIPDLIGGITHQQMAFASSIEAGLADIQFPNTAAAAQERVLRFFSELVEWSGPGAGGSTVYSAKIDRLQANYTMESERRTHLASLRSGAAGGPLQQVSAELFGEANSPTTAGVGRAGNITLSSTAPAPGKPAGASDLGDNVELF